MHKVLVITGASRGIGLATARQFLDSGYAVVNLSRNPVPLEGVKHISADLADEAWYHDVADQLLAEVSGADQITLIHNAGLLQGDSMQQVEANAMRRVMQINVIACVQLNQLLLPLMKSGSSIIYVGSTLGEKAVAGACSYVVSKHALIGLMRASCQDLAGSGIHTVCVCPGFTDTEMLRAHVGGAEEVLQSISGGVTFNRLIEPVEIANNLFFCAQNPVINGAVIHANLGQVER